MNKMSTSSLQKKASESQVPIETRDSSNTSSPARTLNEKDNQEQQQNSSVLDPTPLTDEKTDWSQHTLKNRPWRPRATDFSAIIQARYRGSGTPEDPYIVQWLGHDPTNPKNWSMRRKIAITMVASLMTLCVSLASSAYTGAAREIIGEFHCSEEVFLIGLSLFVLGFGTGPLVWAPLSETMGRRKVLIFSFVFYTFWTGICIAAKNIQTLIVFRAFAGIIGSAAMVVPGGQVADLFEAKQRGVAMAAFSAAPFLGPTVGPIVGGFLAEGAGWRWLFGLLTIFAGVLTVVAILVMPETYAPVLLRERARLLSKVTGKFYTTKIDQEQHVDVKMRIKAALTLPWALLFREPIVLLLTIYMAVVYGTLYLCFAAFPIIFQEGRGWSAGLGGLPFLGIMVGMFIGVAVIIFDNKRYSRLHDETGGFVPPEVRLPPCIIGGVFTIVGLAWLAACTSPSIPWIVPILAGVPFGTGFLLIFMSCTNYLIDSYVIYGASVMAANSVLRSLFGAVFPLFTTYMYENIGDHWGSAVPGFLALACFPFPIFFYKYGPSIRAKCKYSLQAARFLESLRSDLERQKSRASQGAAPEDAV
ncbi:putative MFS multidrug transporter [Exophiala viscosa]|uniref:putative MFS multidrug transporter n=1 Tax=Exophiala viscosa TaxID=2486360 RepID=UPI002192E79F|nr:putative MFS multidrug transporter [Exophiala viscosa]